MFYFEVHPVLDAATNYFKHRPLELRASDAKDLRGWQLGLERAIDKYSRRGRARTVATSPADDLEKLHAKLRDAVELCEDVEAAMLAPPVTRPSREWMVKTLEDIERARKIVDGAALGGQSAFRTLILAESTTNCTIKERLSDLKHANESLKDRVASARAKLDAALTAPPPPPPPPPPPAH